MSAGGGSAASCCRGSGKAKLWRVGRTRSWQGRQPPLLCRVASLLAGWAGWAAAGEQASVHINAFGHQFSIDTGLEALLRPVTP